MLAYKLDILADCGAYPTLGAFLAEPDRADVERRLRDPADRGRGDDGGHEHDADRRLPRRRPARGDPGDRARDRPLRRRDRHGPGRGAAQELHRQGRVPVHDRHRRDVRLGRLRGRARPRAALGRLRRAARRAEAAPRRGRRRSSSGSASPRTSRSRTRSARREFGEVEITAGRRRDRPHRLVLARPGPRDDLRDDRRRAARAAAREDHRRTRATPTRSRQRHRHVRVEVDCRSAARRRAARPTTVVEQAKQLVADYLEANADGHRPRHRRSAASTSPARPSPSLSWAELADARGRRRPARRAEGGARVPGRARRSRSARTSRSSRSTPRPAQVELQRLVCGRRRRHAHQPADRRGPGARRRRDRRRAGALRGVRLRRGRQAADGQLRRLRVPVRRRAAVVGDDRDGDADAGEPARREGHRRVRDDRLDAGRPQRRRRRARAATA